MTDPNLSVEPEADTSPPNDPLFSIVIPAYNREGTIERCLRSCLTQDHQRFEIIVVDDASTDGTVKIVERMSDPRLRIIKLSQNSQVSVARNEGSRVARGSWLVYLDSDDVLLPGYLRRMEETISDLAPGLSVIASPYLHCDGPMSPQPLLDKEVLDFTDYLRWQDVIQGSTDMLICRRRETWERFPWPSTRARQALTCYRVYSNYKLRVLREPGGKVHADARNRYNSSTSAAARQMWKRDGGDIADSRVTLMDEFGPLLKESAPRTFRKMLRSIPNAYLMAGHRWLGFKHMLRYLREFPLSAKGWIMLILGLVGPGAITWAVGKRKARPTAGQHRVSGE
ncbi:MAG: glycosyltransferase family 2 protein [Phycisphaerae bacterium]